MVHNRIASDLRGHFSTVGPSPVRTPDLSFPSSTPSQGTPRLTLLPASGPPSQTSSPAWPSTTVIDLVRIASHRCAAFFAEAAVLVLVLGILDRFLASHRIELRWISGAFLISLGLLAASIVTDVVARRWLRRH